MSGPKPRNPGGRPRTHPRGWARIEVVLPPEAAKRVREASRARGAGLAAFGGRLMVMGLEVTEKADRLDI